MGWRAEMQSLYESLQLLGMESLDSFWFPTLIWTFVAVISFLLLRLFKSLNPIYLYHLRVATMVAIPIGLITSFVIQNIGARLSSTNFDPTIFVVETPQVFYLSAEYSTINFNPNWFEPNFLIGLITTLLLTGSVLMILRLCFSYLRLKKLHRTLQKTKLTNISWFDTPTNEHIEVSFHEHPMVPFTFGWKKPIIVLPVQIKHDSEKVRMAIQHELVHIHRGDYLLQLVLSVIESVFWFHPLIHLGSREIETYREISCDQQVLSTSGISLKNYASMLYELLPLNKEFGSFSVSMAVKQSTLRQRIETMKYHNIYNTSVKRSLLFLILMITVVTIPIACSDMREPELISPDELEKIRIELNSPQIEINGLELKNSATSGGISTQGLGALLINAKEYGIFKIALHPFNGAKLAGEIDGNTITFSHNEMNVSIISNSQIMSKFGESLIWVEHLAIDTKQFSIAALTNLNSEIPPPPPFGILSESTKTILPPPPLFEEDHFVVVEEMPKLVGGIRSVQSKIKNPEEARKAGIEGRVLLQFIVDENGDVLDPKIVRGIGGGADEEALRVIRDAKFEPGIQRGKEVKVQYSLPIVFRLSDTD